jgi:hypothetical protein
LNDSSENLPIGGFFSFENFSRAAQSLIVAKAKTLSQYHLFSDTCCNRTTKLYAQELMIYTGEEVGVIKSGLICLYHIVFISFKQIIHSKAQNESFYFYKEP